MTLGGLALSVGILVDQAIVTIENIERHLQQGKPLLEAIDVGAGEIGVPAFVSTLCICIVFVPDVLFVRRCPLPVCAAGRSRCVCDAGVVLAVAKPGADAGDVADARQPWRNMPTRAQSRALLQRLYLAFDRQFERLRKNYALVLSALLAHRASFILFFLGFCMLSCLLFPTLGRDFFPSVDAGQIRLHMRAATGTRIEETAQIADAVQVAIRELIPANELETILDNIGVPNSGINLSYSNAGTIGTLDGELLMSLRRGHRPTPELVVAAAARIAETFPGCGVLLPAG